MEDGQNNPIIDGPPPSQWAGLMSALKATLASLRARKAATPAPHVPTDKPAKVAKAAPTADPDELAREANNRKAWLETHGKPAIWMAPFFLAFAFAFGLPLAAQFMEPNAAKAMVTATIAGLPSVAAPIEPMVTAWLWAPWWVALPALLMRLRAAWTTRQAMMDAVGWGMGALAIEGLAWLWVGRKTLTTGGFTLPEQEGAWHLLAAEFVFLLLTSILFGPTNRYRALYQRD